MYGENPSDNAYINALYQNVLGRGASTEEIAYYQDHFDKGIWDRPQVMINFAESPENISLVTPTGEWYISREFSLKILTSEKNSCNNK